MLNLFITGGSGFIGSNIIKKLIDNYNISNYDLVNNNINNKVNYIYGDILDKQKLLESTKKTDIIIHCAAICGINKIKKNPKLTLDTNYKGTENVLECVKKHNIKNVLLFSTSEIYGKYCIGYDELKSINIEKISDNERSIYQISKLLDETIAWLYYKELSNNITIVRPFNIYGPNQKGDGAIKNFIVNSLKNEDININGDGSILRSWCFIDDLVNYITKCIETFSGYKIYNIGNNDIISIKQLAYKIKKQCNSSSKIKFKEKLNDDVIIRFPNVNKAEQELNYSCKVTLEEGIERTIDYFRKIL